MTRDEQKTYTARLIAERLSADVGEWKAERFHVVGPGTTGIGVVEHEGEPDGHVDVGFLLNRGRTEVPIIWDCMSGTGETPARRIERGLHTWHLGTWPVIRELLSGKSEHAPHLRGDGTDGIPGWHVIHGPLLAFGDRENAQTLQTWCLENPLLPAIARHVREAFDREVFNGIKLLIGGKDGAEVRINGVAHREASEALAALAWPRLDPFCAIRVFALAITPEGPTPA